MDTVEIKMPEGAILFNTVEDFKRLRSDNYCEIEGEPVGYPSIGWKVTTVSEDYGTYEIWTFVKIAVS